MKLKAGDIEKIRRLRKEGFKIREIAAMFGVSPRRIQQVLKNPELKVPGRKNTEIPSEAKDMIIQLGKEGYTIDRIQEALKLAGYSISRYKVWKLLKEYRENQTSKELSEFRKIIKSHRHTVYIGIIHLGGTQNNSIKLLILLKVPECQTLSCETFDSISLKKVIQIFDMCVLQYQCKPDLVVLSPVPPLVPTKGSENRLIRHLTKIGVKYVWFPKTLKKTYEREIKKVKKLFKSQYSCSQGLITLIEEMCKRFYGVSDYEGVDKDT
ncbi:hypothetical protein [Thermococcus sp.]|uniref:hypothetical protein n=1 Tax=Thermococcus sp. TaxID=35749 RepID=UPI002604F234|nr:hypothetical protein [Thermococcus sp.]